MLLGLGGLVEELEDLRMHGRAAHDRGAAAEPVVALVLRVAAADVGRVRDVDRDRDRRLQLERGRARAGEVADLLLHDREPGDVARRAALLGDAARNLERDVAAEAIVERARGDAPVAQLERRARDERGVADADERPCLVPVPGADVEIEIVEVERLAIVAALALLLPRADHGRERPVLRQDLEPLAEQHVRVEPAERAHGEHAVVAGVRDDERDLVDVADDREQRAAGGARHAHPRRAEHVARDLAERTRGVAPDRRGRALLARRPGGDEQALECLRDRHRARRYRARG